MMSKIIDKFGNCAISTNDKKIVFKEKQSKFTGINDSQKEFLKINIDGCLEFDGKKCDYMLIKTENNEAFFVELKGNHLHQAIEQLKNSIEKIEKNYVEKLTNKKAFIVLTRYPKASSKTQNFQKNFQKLKTKLFIKNKEITFNLNTTS